MLKYFIEVCSGHKTFLDKLKGILHINAPITNKHYNLLSQISKEDIILHYLTISLTHGKKWQAAFVGESIVNHKMVFINNKIIVKIRNVNEFENPVKLSNVKTFKNISDLMNRAIRMSMQSYIFQIEESDYLQIKNTCCMVSQEND